MYVLSDALGYEAYYNLTNSEVLSTLDLNRIDTEKEFGTIAYMINSDIDLGDKRNLPVSKLTFKKGVNLVGFPFDFRDRLGVAIPGTIPDVADIFDPKTFSKVGDGTTAVNSNGTTWSSSYPITHLRGFEVHAEKDIVLYVIEKIQELGSGAQTYTIDQGWNLIPYGHRVPRSVEDSGISSYSAIVKRVRDGSNKSMRYDGSNWVGNIKNFELGRAYYVFRHSAGSINITPWKDMQSAGYYPSALEIPGYINDIPRKYEEEPDNWLWDDNFAMGLSVEPGNTNQLRVYWDRARTWSGKYMLGDKIKYEMYDEENAVYKYQVLPPGENDWLMAFSSIDDVFYCCGATRLNDAKFSSLLESSTYIDPKNWDPYVNPDHMALLGNPEDYDTDGTTYGKYIQAYIDVEAQDSVTGTHPHYVSFGEKIFLMTYDSVLNKFYWMKEVFAGTNNVVLSTACTGENDIIHHNVYQDNTGILVSANYDVSARDLIPIKSERVSF